MTVQELGDRMSAAEFGEWRAFDHLHPLGDQRVARQLVLLTTLFANAHRGKREAFTMDDFDLYRARVPLTREQEEARFVAAFRSAGLLVDKSTPTDGP